MMKICGNFLMCLCILRKNATKNLIKIRFTGWADGGPKNKTWG